MNTSKSKVNKVMGEPTPQRAGPSRVSPRKLRKVLRAIDRAKRAWDRRARFFPHPDATHARVVDLPEWRESIADALILTPALPRGAWVWAVAGIAHPMSRRGEPYTGDVTTAQGGRPLRGFSRPDAIAHLAAVATRHMRSGHTAPRARRAAESFIRLMDAEVA